MGKYILILLSVIVVSCETKTNEDIIKSAFYEYINQNFDDPSLFKEVVSINYGDTLTNKSLAEMVFDYSIMADSTQNLFSELTDKVIEYANKYGNKVRHNQSFKKDWNEYVESLENNLEKRWDFVQNDFVHITKDSILNYKDFAILDFTIKYRVSESNSLKMKETRGFFDLKTSNVFFEETVNDSLFVFFKNISKTTDYYKSKIDINSDVIEKCQRVISYFE